jgi:hypothetical protein
MTERLHFDNASGLVGVAVVAMSQSAGHSSIKP